MAQNDTAADAEQIWTDPFVPNDEIGRRTGTECVRCMDCGLTTMVGTEDEVVHGIGCSHRGGSNEEE